MKKFHKYNYFYYRLLIELYEFYFINPVLLTITIFNIFYSLLRWKNDFDNYYIEKGYIYLLQFTNITKSLIFIIFKKIIQLFYFSLLGEKITISN